MQDEDPLRCCFNIYVILPPPSFSRRFLNAPPSCIRRTRMFHGSHQACIYCVRKIRQNYAKRTITNRRNIFPQKIILLTPLIECTTEVVNYHSSIILHHRGLLHLLYSNSDHGQVVTPPEKSIYAYYQHASSSPDPS